MIRYLSSQGFADRIGIALSTLQRYARDGRLPEPDAAIGEPGGERYGWLPETVDTWQASRPGKGGRPRKNQAGNQ